MRLSLPAAVPESALVPPEYSSGGFIAPDLIFQPPNSHKNRYTILQKYGMM